MTNDTFALMKQLLTSLTVFGILLLSSCNLNQSVMLKNRGFDDFDSLPSDTDNIEYLLAPNDQLSFRLFANDGFQLVDLGGLGNSVGPTNSNLRAINNVAYTVEFDGMVNFPLVGRIPIAGMTLREAEYKLEEIFRKDYVKPFVLLQVLNRRVIIFPGTGSSARVLILPNQNTTLIEALAQVGGIANIGKAQRIKVIRGDADDPQVFLIDLSTMETLEHIDFVLQGNDIIYVEPLPQYASRILERVTPYLSVFSTALLTYITIQNLGNQ